MGTPRLQLRLFASALAMSAMILSDSGAVNIYRIGGESLPPPDIDGALETMQLNWDELPAPEVEGEASRFVQLPWAGTDEALLGSSYLVELDTDFIGPNLFDPNVNLTPSVKAMGGSIKSTDGYTFKDEEALDFMFDEDPTTAYSGRGSIQFSWGPYKVLEVDLGGPLPISHIVMYPTPRYANHRFVTEFTIAVNDGDERKDGLRGLGPTKDAPEGITNRNVQFARGLQFRDWEEDGTVFSSTENRISTLDLEVKSFPTQKIFLIGRIGDWEIAELEIYGDGYVPRAGYRSNILDLGEPSTMGDLVWTGARDVGATVDLITRNGNTPDPNTYWRYTFRGEERSRLDADGKPLTRAAFAKLEGGEQAGITPDTENWEFWSTPLDFDGGEAPLAADRPRQYVQFDVDLRSANVASGSRLDYLEFRVSSPPIASQVVAEIAPPVVEARTLTQFRYLVLPNLRKRDLGFDSIEIETATEVTSVDSVRINEVYLDESEWGWQAGSTSFVVNLPHIDVQRTNELIEIVFQTEVFKFGTVFHGRVFDSARLGEPRQRVTAGDADGLVDSNTLSVGLADLGQSSIQALQLSSPVATPNGDGINDAIEISFDLVNLSGAVPVTLSLYDLAGRKVVDVFDGPSTSGRQSATWDGRIDDGAGTLAVPGVYIMRLEVDADEESTTAFGVVSVAY